MSHEKENLERCKIVAVAAVTGKSATIGMLTPYHAHQCQSRSTAYTTNGFLFKHQPQKNAAPSRKPYGFVCFWLGLCCLLGSFANRQRIETNPTKLVCGLAWRVLLAGSGSTQVRVNRQEQER